MCTSWRESRQIDQTLRQAKLERRGVCVVGDIPNASPGFRDAVKVLKRAQEDLAIRDSKRGIRLFVELVLRDGYKLLWVRLKYQRSAFLVGQE